MCFYKRTNKSLPLVAKEDIYVLKSSLQRVGDTFESQHYTQTYLIGKTYKKGWLWRRKAKKQYSLNDEVFHAFKHTPDNKFNLSSPYTGLFVIPKGTKYYENEREVATFRIKFMGPVKESDRDLLSKTTWQ